jgi:hypothetical protein
MDSTDARQARLNYLYEVRALMPNYPTAEEAAVSAEIGNLLTELGIPRWLAVEDADDLYE